LLPLRFPKLWSLLGWLFVVSVIVGSLIPGPALEAVAVDVNDKVMHASAYFVLMVWFAGFYTRTAYPLIAAVLLVLGIGLDLLQGLTETRTFDWYDVAMNSAGVIVGLAASLSLLGGWCQRVEQRLLS
jgi:VanZ family protein